MDSRLVELVAACLCWAEWPDHRTRTDEPLSYWQTVDPCARERYLADAEIIADAMSSDRHYAIVPVEPTQTMIERAMNAGRGIRSPGGARDVLREMVSGARYDLGWRTEKKPHRAEKDGEAADG